MTPTIIAAIAAVGIGNPCCAPRYAYMPLIPPTFGHVVTYHAPVIYDPPVYRAPVPVRYVRPIRRYYAAPPVPMRGCYTLPSGRRICPQ